MAFSCISSCIVVLTGFLFPTMRKGKVFMQILMWISMCDAIASLFAAFGWPPNGSILCLAQAYTSTAFYRCSWFWTMMLSYQLLGVALHDRVILSLQMMHVIVWSFGILFFLLPLAGATYGGINRPSGVGNCFLHSSGSVDDAHFADDEGGNNIAQHWQFWWVITFVLPLMLTIIFVCYCLFCITKRNKLQGRSLRVEAILKSMIPYPIVFFVGWAPLIIFGIMDALHDVRPRNLSSYGFFAVITSSGQSGTYLALIFFIYSPEARVRWRLLLSRLLRLSSLGEQLRDESLLPPEQDDIDFDWEEGNALPRHKVELRVTEVSSELTLGLSGLSLRTSLVDAIPPVSQIQSQS